VGKAVCRNRVRRRLREIYRLHEEELKPGYDLVIVARVRAAHASYWELDRSFSRLARKLGLRREEEK
jgi:ribonuclease P protein component